MGIPLVELAEVIRSKNSGPYELTLDIIFREDAVFRQVCAQGLINQGLIAKTYGIAETDVLGVIEFIPAKAIKINLRRPVPSGSLGDTDVYGAQQHAPLLGLELALAGAD